MQEAIAAPALPAALVSSAPPVMTGKPGSSSEAAAVESGSDEEACVVVDEVLCPALRSQIHNFAAEIQESRSYTGVAAFNIGFGAKTACSAFRIFPNAAFKKELKGDQFRALEKQ